MLFVKCCCFVVSLRPHNLSTRGLFGDAPIRHSLVQIVICVDDGESDKQFHLVWPVPSVGLWYRDFVTHDPSNRIIESGRDGTRLF